MRCHFLESQKSQQNPDVIRPPGQDSQTSFGLSIRDSRLGVLYIGATEDNVDPFSLNLLKQFADRVGVCASLAIHQERLVEHGYEAAT